MDPAQLGKWKIFIDCMPGEAGLHSRRRGRGYLSGHVILRYRLERALLDGDMTLDELPAAWNDGMKELLGIVPPTDREGCLQDVHWYDGAWGYFHVYPGCYVGSSVIRGGMRRGRCNTRRNF